LIFQTGPPPVWNSRWELHFLLMLFHVRRNLKIGIRNSPRLRAWRTGTFQRSGRCHVSLLHWTRSIVNRRPSCRRVSASSRWCWCMCSITSGGLARAAFPARAEAQRGEGREETWSVRSVKREVRRAELRSAWGQLGAWREGCGFGAPTLHTHDAPTPDAPAIQLLGCESFIRIGRSAGATGARIKMIPKGFITRAQTV